ncbi:unnamed protein product [Diamesa hyperborea]
MILDFNKVQFKLSKDLEIPECSKKHELFVNRCLKQPEEFKTLCGYIVDEFELTEQFQWKNDDVLEWIENLGFPQYKETFKENLIHGRSLLSLDASALVQMNIHDFEHIKKITQDIRRMYNVEKVLERSISILPRLPDTHYKFYRTQTGPIYELCTRSCLFKKMKLMKETEVQLNHFEKLHLWLQHHPDFQQIRIGLIKRVNLFFVKSGPHQDVEEFLDTLKKCCCIMPPCECNSIKKAPWKISLIVDINNEKSDNIDCMNLMLFN